MSDLLGKIADRLAGDEDRRAGGSRWAWVVGLVLALVGMAVGAFVAWRDRRELARLRHAQTVREIEVRAADTEAAIAAGDEAVMAAMVRVHHAEERAAEAALALQRAQEKHDADLAAIDRIRTWRDVDPGAR